MKTLWRKSKSAFTLVELLVVISAIGVLCALVAGSGGVFLQSIEPLKKADAK